ncbi:MAG: Phosphatidylinositol 4-kinase pik1alpha (PI4-kinase)(PtdIns-4-kinase) [Phylliscum demangeonii]|nr:MAG: Phosphatidylinositol 4-kinase pik1alpha (PI4-kinase)(PtdIns-4-kinase) [Phylliscum demangeonii]
MDEPDLSGLAAHMRAAAQMLAQLESSGVRRPKDEVATIRDKIIASMQSLEEHCFDADGSKDVSTFDAIIPESTDPVLKLAMDNAHLDSPTEPKLGKNTGAARMENDLKTGGMEQNADRDDPSAVTFGEEWTTKKERIKRTSPFGGIPNWDLLST